MKIGENTFVALDYKLEVDGQVADQSQPGQPLKFAYGMGMLLPKFEEAIEGLEPGAEFAFTLTATDGYGEVIKEAVVELPKNVFEVNGEVEPGLLEIGNMIPMADQQGNRLMGRVVAVAEVVTMDFGGGCSCGCEEGEDCSCDECPGDDKKGGCDCGC